MLTPSTRISPEVAVSIPPRIFNTVVFPAPLGPTITTNSPFSMVKLIPSTAWMVISDVYKRQIFCDPHQELDAILSASAKEDTAFADLGFSPVSGGTCVPTEEKGDTLFLLKGKENIWKGRQLTFPHLFHT